MKTKEKPVTAGEVKEFISGKFGNVSRFCLISGRDITETHNLLKSGFNSSELQALRNIAERTRNRKTVNEIRARQRNLLKREVSRAGGIAEFCLKYGFLREVVSRILSRQSKNLSKRVREVFSKLEILENPY